MSALAAIAAALASAQPAAPQGDGAILRTLGEIWDYRLFTVQGSDISVSMIVLGFSLFIFGLLVSRILSGLFTRRVISRMAATEGGAAAVQTLTFYTLLVIFTFFALTVVGIPLTAFTVLGGALAIGVGLGSQNIVNNFISGLILHLERPIKTGDLIEVAGTKGVVEHIGARSTRVLTAANTHIIVPNSSFLEQNVLNWSYSNHTVRIEVVVGVAYGSPTREVERLLLETARADETVFDKPAPLVRFEEFGDNSLVFILYCWIPARALRDLWQTQSELRHRIDEVFKENGIVIAFPQRDVHLDAARPIPVQVVSAGA